MHNIGFYIRRPVGHSFPAMKKPKSDVKARRNSDAGKTTAARKPAVKKPAAKKPPVKPVRKGADKTAKSSGTESLPSRIAAAKKIEAMDRPMPEAKPAKAKLAAAPRLSAAGAPAANPQRNSDFPNTYIQEISIRLEDPDHPVTLKWTGPNAAAQETGPFRSSPGAGLRGLNCDNVATSRRSGSNCTPKGTFTVTGFAPQLPSHPEAKDVTWFVPARGIALHYYPSVPVFPASHGCVRLTPRRVAQLIRFNSRVGVTKVVVDGTWTKPGRQH